LFPHSLYWHPVWVCVCACTCSLFPHSLYWHPVWVCVCACLCSLFPHSLYWHPVWVCVCVCVCVYARMHVLLVTAGQEQEFRFPSLLPLMPPWLGRVTDTMGRGQPCYGWVVVKVLTPLDSNYTTPRKNTLLLLGRGGRPGSPVFSIDTAGGRRVHWGPVGMKVMAP